MPPFQVILHDHACMHDSYLGRVGKHADAADDLPAGIPLSDTATKELWCSLNKTQMTDALIYVALH